MRRRKYFTCIVLPMVSSGCSAFGSGTPTSETDRTASDQTETSKNDSLIIDAPTLDNGETGSITISAYSAESLRIIEEPDIEPDLVAYSDVDLSPSPHVTYQISPPNWTWSTPQDVSGTLPVEIPSSLPSGTYQYQLLLGRGSDSDNVTKQFSIIVE